MDELGPRLSQVPWRPGSLLTCCLHSFPSSPPVSPARHPDTSVAPTPLTGQQGLVTPATAQTAPDHVPDSIHSASLAWAHS